VRQKRPRWGGAILPCRCSQRRRRSAFSAS
jgi:hypothetical protein